MKKEIEVKFFVDDLSGVRKKLKKLRARFEGVYSEHDFMLDNKAGDLKRKRETLRIRKSDEISFLTFKTKVAVRAGFKVADEHEIEINDAMSLKKIFEHLGFRVVFEYKKPKREYWKYLNSHVTLDSFPFGKFVEVEGSKEKIRRIAKDLRLDLGRTSAKSYRKLIEEYRKHKKITY